MIPGTPPIGRVTKIEPISSVRPARRTCWAYKREDGPACFSGTHQIQPCCLSGQRDTAVAYTGEYPIAFRQHLPKFQRTTSPRICETGRRLS